MLLYFGVVTFDADRFVKRTRRCSGGLTGGNLEHPHSREPAATAYHQQISRTNRVSALSGSSVQLHCSGFAHFLRQGSTRNQSAHLKEEIETHRRWEMRG